MRITKNIKLAAGLLLASVGASGFAAEPAAPDLGKQEFQANCVICHGADGKGGAYVDMLRTTPPDLTQLAKKNGGVFPVARVYEAIDGRNLPRAHGGSDMPIWGQQYRMRAAEHYVDVPYNEDAYVRARILALIDYLNRMQAK